MKGSQEWKNYINWARHHCAKSPYRKRKNGVIPICFFDSPDLNRKESNDKKNYTFDDELDWGDDRD